MTRKETLERRAEPWDLVVIGGGITGAGILREAVRDGYKALLLEKRDFSWGTSSRSSKLVHGGLRYLKQGDVFLTRDSVRERERLIREGKGLVHALGFLFATYEGESPRPFVMKAGLTLYDLLAGKSNHHHHSADEVTQRVKGLSREGLRGAFWYGDAGTDDSRLVLRVVAEAVKDGGAALNDASVEGLLFASGRVSGVVVKDALTDETYEVEARAVINATGVWVDGVRKNVQGKARMRPLRGSHLVFPRQRLPVDEAVTLLHPRDGRPVFLIPWEGATLLGTTDVDHKAPLDEEPVISHVEIEYLLELCEKRLPSVALSRRDVISTYSGVRPVVSSGTNVDPSKESRDHVVWNEKGLVTVTGGKLTTFRLIAKDALRAVRRLLPPVRPSSPRALDSLDDLAPLQGVSPETAERLLGRHGADAPALVAMAHEGELESIAGSPYSWAELRFAARHERVNRLDDLLLRRVRLGLVVPEGGKALLPRIRTVCQAELGWDDDRWWKEQKAYNTLVKSRYGLPI